MQLNKIYRYHGISRVELYTHLKTTFTEAFSGFDGVSFETVSNADAASGFEEYKIYLNAEKSMWLRIYWNGNSASSVHTIEMCFKNDQNKTLTTCVSGDAYRYYNIVRTNYGVMFSTLQNSGAENKLQTDDSQFQFLFTIGNPNIFVYANGGMNLSVAGDDFLWSDLHTSVERSNSRAALNSSIDTVSNTTIYNATSALEPIKCDHLYRLAIYSGKTGKMLIGDKYVILGCRYALEYDTNDDRKEV